MSLAGRRVLVTGAARGLGETVARHLAGAGAELVIADILEDEGRSVADEVGANFHPLDLRDPESITALAEAVGDDLHGLVNNGAIATGIGGVGFEDVDIETWDRVMEVNVRGTWLMVRAFAPILRRAGNGRIVNVASDTALWGAPNLMSYIASKGAVISMTRSLARELGPDGVGVTAIAPGILTTESTDYVPRERHALYEDGRAVPGPQPPEDIAGTIAFLLGDAALTLTGQVPAGEPGLRLYVTTSARLADDLRQPWRHGEHLDGRGFVLEDPLVLDGMDVRGFDLSNAHLKSGMSARGATFQGLVWLQDTTIDGACDLTGARFRIDLRAGGMVTDSLRLDAAQVLGILDLARLRARTLTLSGALVMANLTLESAEIAEEIDLTATEIMGGFWADGARFGRMLSDGVDVEGRVRNGSASLSG